MMVLKKTEQYYAEYYLYHISFQKREDFQHTNELCVSKRSLSEIDKGCNYTLLQLYFIIYNIDMKTLYKVKNKSSDLQSIVAIGTFDPGQVREVSYNKMRRLMRNPNFEMIEEDPTLEEVVQKTSKTATKKSA